MEAEEYAGSLSNMSIEIKTGPMSIACLAERQGFQEGMLTLRLPKWVFAYNQLDACNGPLLLCSRVCCGSC